MHTIGHSTSSTMRHWLSVAFGPFGRLPSNAETVEDPT